jgi:cell wall-associated NlpC family hydrolase
VIEARAIVEESRSWIDVPFQHQGRTRHGVDCIGLILCVMDAVGALPADLPAPDYPRQVKDGALLRAICERCVRTPRPESGGLILIQWPMMKVPTHVAIYSSGGNMVHAYQRAHRVCEIGYRAQWARWTHSFHRLPGVAYE